MKPDRERIAPLVIVLALAAWALPAIPAGAAVQETVLFNFGARSSSLNSRPASH